MLGSGRKLTEVEIMEPVVHTLEKTCFNVFPEILVTINGETYPVDLIAQSTISPDTFQWFEGKRRLTWELVEQCKRGLPYAKLVTAVVQEPKSQSPKHKRLREQLESAGIGLWYVSLDGRITMSILAQDRYVVNVGPVKEAIKRNARSEPAKAGSAAARRKKSRYEHVIRYLREEGGTATIKAVRRTFDWTQTDTSKFKKAVRDGVESDFEIKGGVPLMVRLREQPK